MNSRNRHTILLVSFAIMALLSFFFSPWEDGAKQFFEEEQYIQFMMNENDPITFTFFRIILFGIADSIELLGYSMHTIKEHLDDELLIYIIPALTVIIYYIGQIVVSRVNAFYEEEIVYDSLWEKLFDLFCFENIFTYLLSLLIYLLVNVISRQISIFSSGHEMLSLFLGMLLLLLCAGVLISIFIYYFIYLLAIMIPVAVLAIPALNSMTGVVLFLVCEVIFIAIIWRNYIADRVLKLSLYIALFPIRFIEDRFS